LGIFFFGFCLEKERPGRKEGRQEGRKEGMSWPKRDIEV
jgi:predicted transposase YdaD